MHETDSIAACIQTRDFKKKKYEHQGELTYIASLLLCVQYCFRIKVMHALLLVYLAHTPRSGTQHIS